MEVRLYSLTGWRLSHYCLGVQQESSPSSLILPVRFGGLEGKETYFLIQFRGFFFFLLLTKNVFVPLFNFLSVSINVLGEEFWKHLRKFVTNYIRND